jgi:hypothetical protein
VVVVAIRVIVDLLNPRSNDSLTLQNHRALGA